MIAIAQRDEPKGLETRVLCLWHGLEHLSHAVDRARTGRKGNFHAIAGAQLLLKLEESAGDRYRLKFCTRMLASVGMNGSRNGSIELYTWRTPGSVVAGEVGHIPLNMTLAATSGEITKAPGHERMFSKKIQSGKSCLR